MKMASGLENVCFCFGSLAFYHRYFQKFSIRIICLSQSCVCDALISDTFTNFPCRIADRLETECFCWSDGWKMNGGHNFPLDRVSLTKLCVSIWNKQIILRTTGASRRLFELFKYSSAHMETKTSVWFIWVVAEQMFLLTLKKLAQLASSVFKCLKRGNQ